MRLWRGRMRGTGGENPDRGSSALRIKHGARNGWFVARNGRRWTDDPYGHQPT